MSQLTLCRFGVRRGRRVGSTFKIYILDIVFPGDRSCCCQFCPYHDQKDAQLRLKWFSNVMTLILKSFSAKISHKCLSWHIQEWDPPIFSMSASHQDVSTAWMCTSLVFVRTYMYRTERSSNSGMCTGKSLCAGISQAPRLCANHFQMYQQKSRWIGLRTKTEKLRRQNSFSSADQKEIVWQSFERSEAGIVLSICVFFPEIIWHWSSGWWGAHKKSSLALREEYSVVSLLRSPPFPLQQWADSDVYHNDSCLLFPSITVCFYVCWCNFFSNEMAAKSVVLGPIYFLWWQSID